MAVTAQLHRQQAPLAAENNDYFLSLGGPIIVFAYTYLSNCCSVFLTFLDLECLHIRLLDIWWVQRFLRTEERREGIKKRTLNDFAFKYHRRTILVLDHQFLFDGEFIII